MKKSLAVLVTLILPLLFSATTARAVIEVKFPLKKDYVTSKLVLSATITKLDPEKKDIQAKVATLYKGKAPADNLIGIRVKAPAELFDQLNAAKDHSQGATLIIMEGGQSAVVHIADHWYTAALAPRTGNYVVEAPNTDYAGTFPGIAANLVKALDEIKVGKSTLVDAFPPFTLPNPQKIADLPAHALAFAAVPSPDLKSANFLITTSEGMRGFTFDGKSISNESKFEPSKPPEQWVVGTIDHKAVILQGNTLSFLDNGKVAKYLDIQLPKEKILAAALTGPTDDAQPDSLIIATPNGLLRYSLANPTAPPDDDLRLTGSKLLTFFETSKDGFSAASLVSVDLNNDNRPDLILLTPEGSLTLLNRGFGCYLVNKTIAAPLLEPLTPPAASAPAVESKFKNQRPTGALPLLASTPHTLYRLNPDGSLYRYELPAK